MSGVVVGGAGVSLLTTSDIGINKIVFLGKLNWSSIIVGPTYGIAFSGSGTAILASSGIGSTVGTASPFGAVVGSPTWSLASNAGGKYAIHSTSGLVTVAAGLANSTDSVTIHVTGLTPTVSDATFSWTVGTAPTNSVAPAISGSAVQGVTLAGSTGTWAGFPTPTTTPQWKRGTVSIPGATSINYTVQNADVGTTLALAVTGSNVFGSATATSSATATTTKATLSYTPVTAATLNSLYTGATPSTSGGTAPYVYSITAGTLPTGTVLNTTSGVILGTTTVTGTFSGIVLTVTDANSVTDASSAFAVTVTDVSPPVLSLASEVGGVVTLDWDLNNTITAGDVLSRQVRTAGLANWSTLIDNSTHTISPAENTSGVVVWPLTLQNGTWEVRGFVTVTLSGVTSGASNTLTIVVTDYTTGYAGTYYILGF